MPLVNSDGLNFTAVGATNVAPGTPYVVSTTASVFAAVSADGSTILWEHVLERGLWATLPLTVSNDVLFAPAQPTSQGGTAAAAAPIRAISTSTGAKVWQAPSMLSPTSGITVANGVVLFGATMTTNTTTQTTALFAYSL
jgi:hypothetical protein